MDYRKIYDSLIKRSKDEGRIYFRKNSPNRSFYYEKHHILPRCLGGKDIKDNIAVLTAKEHYIAHLLLYKMHPNNKKLAYAFWMMCNIKTDKQERIKVSSKVYNEIRKVVSDNLSNRTLSKETRDRLSVAHKGKKLTEEHKEKVKKTSTGRKYVNRDESSGIRSKKTKEYFKTHKPNFYGCKHTEKTKEIMREKARNRKPISEETRKKFIILNNYKNKTNYKGKKYLFKNDEFIGSFDTVKNICTYLNCKESKIRGLLTRGNKSKDGYTVKHSTNILIK